MKITIIDFDRKAEFQFAAERTAADAARIQAPLQFHGDEPELAEALSGLAPSDIQLHFECHTIMVGMLTMYTLIAVELWFARAFHLYLPADLLHIQHCMVAACSIH